MKFTISKKAIFLFVVLVAILTLSITAYFIQYYNTTLKKEFDIRANIILSSIVLSSEYPVLIEDMRALEYIGNGVLKQSDVVFCGIQDRNGKILFQDGVKGTRNLCKYEAPIVTERFLSLEGETLILDSGDREMEAIGHVYLILSLESVIRQSQQVSTNVVLFVLGGVLLAFILMSLLMRYIVAKPIRILMEGIHRISGGDLQYKVPVNTTDEIGVLAASFNLMTSDLQKTTVSRDYIDNILKNMGEALAVISLKGTIQRVNNALEQMLGYTKQELMGHSIADIWCPDASYTVEELLAEQDNVHQEMFFLRKDGEKIAILFSSSVMEDKEEKKSAIICTARDITERKQAEESLRRYTHQIEKVNKDLDNFTHIISHDLKEPLRSLYAFSKFVVDDYNDKLDEAGQVWLERVMVNAARMQKIVEDLLEISNIEKRYSPYVSINVKKLLGEVRAQLELQLAQKNAQLILSPKLPTIICDELRMKTVFFNLVLNALNFSEKENIVIEVGYRDADDFFEFFVRDNGIGIDPQYFDKIFIIFQRLGRRENSQGTGAGLTITKKIIEVHGGKIWVESKLQEGTTFYFTIPKVPESRATKKKLGEILVEKQLVSKEEIQDALEEQAYE